MRGKGRQKGSQAPEDTYALAKDGEQVADYISSHCYLVWMIY